MSDLGSTRSESETQAQQNAKARLAAAFVLSQFAPSVIAHDPTSDAPYGRDHRGNPRTRHQQELTEGKSPWASGMVGGETMGEAIGMNVYRHHQLGGILGGIAPRIRRGGGGGAGGPRAGGGGAPVAGGGGAMGPVR